MYLARFSYPHQTVSLPHALDLLTQEVEAARGQGLRSKTNLNQ